MRRFPIFIFISILLSLGIFTPIFAQQSTENECLYDGNPTRPGGKCKTLVPYVHTPLNNYTVQCAVTPQAIISAPSSCGSPYPVLHIEGKGDYVDTKLVIDFNKLQLGGLGPDEAAWSSQSIDSLARVYPYNALGDKPLNTSPGTPREAFRTWWRLLPLRQQLAAKGEFIERFNRGNPPIFDSEFPYVPGIGEDLPPEEVKEVQGSMAEDIDKFISAGATGYLIWQYSGDRFRSLASDQYSFWRDSDPRGMCKILKEKSAQYPDKFFGVNMWDLGAHADQAADHFAWLKANCGVSVVRTFIYVNGGNGLEPVIAAAQAAGIKVILTIGNWAIGGGGMPQASHAAVSWYAGDFRGEYLDLTRRVAAASTANPGGVKAIELANEPHCFDLGATAVNNYNNWVRESAATIRAAGWGGDIGIGQFSNHPRSDCDAADLNFVTSNQQPGITIASGHHYNSEIEQEENLKALAVSPVPYFIGEANVSGTTDLPTFKISDLINKLPGCLRTQALNCTDKSAEKYYYGLDPKTRAMYDAFLPFNFDNVRGYLALQYKEFEDENSASNRAGVIAENLPYIQAVLDQLSNKAGGILRTLSTREINARRVFNSNFFDVTYPLDDEPTYREESDKYFELIAKAARSNATWGDWAGDNVCSVLPLKEPQLSSPLTYPTNLQSRGFLDPESTKSGELNQSVLVPVEVKTHLPETLEVENGEIKCIYQETNETCAYSVENQGCPPLYTLHRRDENSRNPDEPVRSSLGRSIISFTNPLMSDISRLISEGLGTNNNSSMYFQFLPKALSSLGFEGYANTPIFAKEATYGISAPGENIDETVSAGNTSEKSAPVRRKGGQLEIDLCKLRNFWLRPAGLQAGTPADCEKLEGLADTPINPTIPGVTTGSKAGELCVPLWVDTATANANAQSIVTNMNSEGQRTLWYDYYEGYLKSFANSTTCSLPEADIVGRRQCTVKQHLFENSCPGGSCLSYVAFKARATTCNGQAINPYLVIAIALNESGGLTSEKVDASNQKHFGCDPFNNIGYAYDIPSKLDCVINTIQGDCGKTEEEILREYGYVGTNNLNSILGVMVDRSSGVCTR